MREEEMSKRENVFSELWNVVFEVEKAEGVFTSCFYGFLIQDLDYLFIILVLADYIGQSTLSAGVTVGVVGHEDSGAADLGWALTTETGDLSVVVNLIVLQHSQLDLLLLMLVLLWSGVNLLLSLLSTTTEAEDKVEGGLLLDVVVRKGAT